MINSKTAHRRAGVSLMETLCVLTILSVLVGLYAWSVMQAFVKIKAFIDTLR
jgi:prepilin-type N-terminal cleavage/methylation domain-containing protein